MRVIVVVSIVLLGACAVSSDKQDLIEDSKDLNEVSLYSNSEAVEADYEPIKCLDFKDLKNKNIIGKLFKKFDAKSPGTPVEKCGQSAKEKNVQRFGIQYKKGKILCREVDEKTLDQDSTAKIGNKCKNGIGFKNSIFIYRKSRKAGINKHSNKQCIFEDKLYYEGDTANMYHSNDDMCKTCECSGGTWVEPCEPKMHCDTPFKQCEETYLPPGHCCPVCRTANKKTCASMGRKYGDSWLKKANENCFFCRCLSEDQEASCEKVQAYCLPTNCENPITPEGKCCPECENQEETTPQAFTINPIPTTDADGEFKFPWER